jgi:hypothetical protein
MSGDAGVLNFTAAAVADASLDGCRSTPIPNAGSMRAFLTTSVPARSPLSSKMTHLAEGYGDQAQIDRSGSTADMTPVRQLRTPD